MNDLSRAFHLAGHYACAHAMGPSKTPDQALDIRLPRSRTCWTIRVPQHPQEHPEEYEFEAAIVALFGGEATLSLVAEQTGTLPPGAEDGCNDDLDRIARVAEQAGFGSNRVAELRRLSMRLIQARRDGVRALARDLQRYGFLEAREAQLVLEAGLQVAGARDALNAWRRDRSALGVEAAARERTCFVGGRDASLREARGV